jgi:hypothetical protein
MPCGKAHQRKVRQLAVQLGDTDDHRSHSPNAPPATGIAPRNMPNAMLRTALRPW